MDGIGNLSQRGEDTLEPHAGWRNIYGQIFRAWQISFAKLNLDLSLQTGSGWGFGFWVLFSSGVGPGKRDSYIHMYV